MSVPVLQRMNCKSNLLRPYGCMLMGYASLQAIVRVLLCVPLYMPLSECVALGVGFVHPLLANELEVLDGWC